MDNTLSFLPPNLKVRTRSITDWKEKLTSKERPTSALLNVSDSFSVVQKVSRSPCTHIIVTQNN